MTNRNSLNINYLPEKVRKHNLKRPALFLYNKSIWADLQYLLKHLNSPPPRDFHPCPVIQLRFVFHFKLNKILYYLLMLSIRTGCVAQSSVIDDTIIYPPGVTSISLLFFFVQPTKPHWYQFVVYLFAVCIVKLFLIFTNIAYSIWIVIFTW